MSESKKLSRRDVLAVSAALGLGALAPPKTEAEAVNDDHRDLKDRRDEAAHIRVDAANEHLKDRLHHHPTNGDEELLPNYIGNFSKGLKHDHAVGEVDKASYESLLTALRNGQPKQFEHIILGTVPPPLPPYKDFNFQACDPKDPMDKVQLRTKAEIFHRVHSERQLITNRAGDKSQAALVNPQAGLAFDLEGIDSHELVMPPPPAFQSKEIIAEIAENYWMALARDIPFVNYQTDPTIKAAAADLSNYEDAFKGPKDKTTGKVTIDTLFRGSTPGDLEGPYISQFMLRDIPFGAYQFAQKVAFSYDQDKNAKDQTKSPDFLIRKDTWLAAQQGEDTSEKNPPKKNPKYIHRSRDLANYVHIDELFQAYFLASLSLGSDPSRGGLGAPHDAGNPYDGYHFDKLTQRHQHRQSTQQGFGTLGEPNFKGMVTEVGTRALKAVWYQKWFVHRRLRPEEFAGRIHFYKDGKRTREQYPFNEEGLKILEDGGLLKLVNDHNKSQVEQGKPGEGWFLPMAFPEGCPIHPAYGAGHATVAGACVTILKAVFHEEITFADLKACVYLPSSDGIAAPKLLKYSDDLKSDYHKLASKLTIGGELNKLASNVSLGRNIAGVHWRSDHAQSLKLGETVALHFLRETVQTYNERVSFRVTKFDGTQVVLSNNRR